MDARSHRLGSALVAAQLSLIGLQVTLVLAAVWQGLSAGRWLLLIALALAAAALGLWTLAANRPGNFNVHPRPREGGRLVTDGPYRHIRHPMYTTVLIGCAAVLPASPAGWTPVGAASWLVLVGVLACKAHLEERWMRRAHPGYQAYAARTRRFVPGLV